MNKEILYKKGRSFDRAIWPIFSLLTLRPIHFWHAGKLANIKDGDKVLEICGGYPFWSIYSHQVGEGIFTSVDIDPVIQKRSKIISRKLTKNPNLLKTNQLLPVADGNKLPFADNTFDLVISHNGVEHNIDESYRVLTPGGKLIISWMELFLIPFFTPLIGRAEIKQTGFENIKLKPSIHTLPPLFGHLFLTATKPK